MGRRRRRACTDDLTELASSLFRVNVYNRSSTVLFSCEIQDVPIPIAHTQIETCRNLRAV